MRCSVIGGMALSAIWLGLAGGRSDAAPLTAFTYQGRLKDGGSPANGSYDVQFTLNREEAGGSIVAGPICSENVAVQDGLFTALVDFGPDVFSGAALWLGIEVRADATPGNCATGVYSPLSPRQALTPAPNALFALTAETAFNTSLFSGQPASFFQNAANLNSGAMADARLSPNVALLDREQSFTDTQHFDQAPEFLAAGLPFTVESSGLVPNLNADLLDGLNSTAFLQSIPVPLTLTGTSATHIIRAENTSTGFLPIALFGRCSGASGNGATGVRGESASNFGRGVYGEATAATGATFGGDFRSPSTSGTGVSGVASASTGTTYGVYGQSASQSGRGVFGLASAASGTTYGGYFQTDSPDGYAGYFTGGKNYFEGNVGIGTATPVAKLDVRAVAAGETAIRGDVTANTGAAGTFSNGLNGNFSGNTLTALCVGNANSQALVATHFGAGDCAVFEITSATSGGEAVEAITNGTGQAMLATNTGTGQAGYFRILNPASSGTALYCETNGGGLAFQANGTARVDVLEITGADLAEKFPVSDETKPGLVMEIDPENPGKLRVARGEYNRRVAGVISGANGLSAGTIMGHLPGNEDAPPVALSGRVWVYSDASREAIEVGDLLTTSSTPGHAMKAVDYSRAQGAAIGKAMTALRRGEVGFVLVLVNLQ